jgi:hypothetical protein
MKFLQYLTERVYVGGNTYRMDYGQIPFYYYKNNIWYIQLDGSIYKNGKVIGGATPGDIPMFTHPKLGNIHHHVQMEDFIPLPFFKMHSSDGLVHGRFTKDNDILLDEKPDPTDLANTMALIKRYIR